MDWELVRRNWRLIMAAKWVIGPLMAISAGAGWWFADYHYSGRIESLKEDLEHKDHPKPPPPVIKEVPTPDPAQAQEIADLKAKLAILEAQSHTASAKPRSGVGSVSGTGNAVSVGQSGGLTVGSIYGVSKPDRVLDDKGKQGLLKLMPPVSDVSAVNIVFMAGEHSDERQKYAEQIGTFLRSQSYNVPEIGSMMYLAPVTPGVTVSIDEKHPATVRISVNENR